MAVRLNKTVDLFLSISLAIVGVCSVGIDDACDEFCHSGFQLVLDFQRVK